MSATKRVVIDKPTVKSNGDMRRMPAVQPRRNKSGQGAGIHKPLRRGR